MDNIFIFITTILVSFPLSHFLLKKGMEMDYNLTFGGEKELSKFFYIPYLNVIIYFIYIIWVIVKFKRPD